MKGTILLGLGLLILSSTESGAVSYKDDAEFKRDAEYKRDINIHSGRLDRDRRIYRGTRLDRDRRNYRADATVFRRGMRGRRYLRGFSYSGNLPGDKKRVYDEYGFTPHRLGFNEGGRRTERWIYYSVGVEFLFEHHTGELLETRYFPRENNHIE